jgi:hypothetical protein
MSDIQISPVQIISVGGNWQKTINLIPESGSVEISGTVTHALYKKNSTTDVSATYVTGSPSHNSGAQVTTGKVLTGTPPPGHYTYFLTVPTTGLTYKLFQEFEVVVEKGK